MAAAPALSELEALAKVALEEDDVSKLAKVADRVAVIREAPLLA